MEIYTSYFGKAKKLNERGIVQIGIARFPPKFFYGHSIQELAPTKDMFYMQREQYDAAFENILEKLNPQQVYERLKVIADKRDIALCCFEKSGDFCHRYRVADWLNKELGLNIKEFDYIPKREPEATQGSLF